MSNCEQLKNGAALKTTALKAFNSLFSAKRTSDETTLLSHMKSSVQGTIPRVDFSGHIR